MYTILWKYRVLVENQNRFEQEYGPDGAWCKLFSSSQYYLKSILSKSDNSNDTYVLMDVWIDKNSYECFLKESKSSYKDLSLKFQNLYETEEKIGSY